MDIHADVQYSEYLEEIQRITGPLSRYQLDQLKELIYRIESRCAIGREDISQLTHQQGVYNVTEHNDATNPRVYSSSLSITESKSGICNSAVVVNDEYLQQPIVIPRLDLSCLLDDESTEKPSSSWDIPVWSMSERLNNIKPVEKIHHETKNGMSYTCNSAVVVNELIIIPRLDLSCLLEDESTEKPSSSWDISVRSPSAYSSNNQSIIRPEIAKLDLNILSERQEDNDTKEDVSVDTGYSHGKLYSKKNPEDNDMKEDVSLDTLYSQLVPRKYNHVYYKPRTMKKCDAKPYGKNKNHYFNKYLAYKKEKAIAATHHETRETRDRKCCTKLLPVYCQDGAVKPDPHKQREVFVNRLLTILDNSEIHL